MANDAGRAEDGNRYGGGSVRSAHRAAAHRPGLPTRVPFPVSPVTRKSSFRRSAKSIAFDCTTPPPMVRACAQVSWEQGAWPSAGRASGPSQRCGPGPRRRGSAGKMPSTSLTSRTSRRTQGITEKKRCQVGSAASQKRRNTRHVHSDEAGKHDRVVTGQRRTDLRRIHRDRIGIAQRSLRAYGQAPRVESHGTHSPTRERQGQQCHRRLFPGRKQRTHQTVGQCRGHRAGRRQERIGGVAHGGDHRDDRASAGDLVSDHLGYHGVVLRASQDRRAELEHMDRVPGQAMGDAANRALQHGFH